MQENDKKQQRPRRQQHKRRTKQKILNLCDDEWRIRDAKRLYITYFPLYVSTLYIRTYFCDEEKSNDNDKEKEKEKFYNKKRMKNIILFGIYTFRNVRLFFVVRTTI